MKKLWMGWAVLMVALLAGCQHRPHDHGGGPGGMGPFGINPPNAQAGVRLTTVGNEVIPEVSREPLMIDRGQIKQGQPLAAQWSLDPRLTGAQVKIRIVGYVGLGQSASLDQLKQAAKKDLPAVCPLVQPTKECGCDSKGGTAVCTFARSEKAVFKYDVCVEQPGGKTSCIDPTGMIN